MQRNFRSKICILALFLALGLIFATPVAKIGTRADAHLEATIRHNVEIYGDLGLEYHVKLNSNVSFSNIYLRLQRQKFSGSGSSYSWETIDLTNYTVENGEYVFRYYGMNTTEMPNLVRATLHAAKGNIIYTSDTDETSIRSYCMDLLKTYAGRTSSKEKALCTLLVDMLNYGAASQRYFNINVSDLANSKLTSSQKTMGSTLPTTFSSCYAYTPLSGSTCSIDHFEMDNIPTTYLNTFLKFSSTPDSNTSLELTYTSVLGVKKTVKKSFSDFTYNTSTKLYKVSFPEIKAPDYQTKLSIVVKKNGRAISGTYTYSVESYIKALVDAGNGTETAWAFVQNFMAYGISSRKYFGVGGSVDTPTPTKKATNTPTPTNSPTPTKKATVTPTPSGGTVTSTYKNSKYTKNMPTAVIVVPAKATSEETYAANMLQLYISREDGYKPSIITDATAQGSRGFEISVGKTNRPHGTAKYSSDGSYSIKSYSNGISILGIGKRGTIDGSAKFLSLCGGYFWLSFEDGYITHQTHFKYETNISYDYKRPFVFTDTDVSYGLYDDGENRMLTLANGLNGYFANLVFPSSTPGYQNWYLYDPVEAHYPANSGIHPGQVHTMLYEYFSEDDFAAHPEWFSMWEGRRQYIQPCLTNPEVYQRIEDHVFEILERGNYDPNAPMQIISLSQADEGVYCQCSNCQKFREKYDSGEVDHPEIKYGLCDGALYLDLCNKISAKVKAAGYKNVYIDMLAYSRTQRNPINMTADDHVIVRYAAIERCYAHNCDASATECKRMYEYEHHLEGWAKVCENAQLWVWEYNANWRSTIAPYPNIDTLVHDIKHYKSLGVTGIYLQSNDSHTKSNTEFGDLRNYISMVLLQDPDCDAEAEIDFFMQEFYGKAGPYIKEYMRILRAQAQRHYPGPNAYPNTSRAAQIHQWRDKVMQYNVYPSQIYDNDYDKDTPDMDAHNRMTDSDIARCQQLSELAMNAVANDTERRKFCTERTLLSWRIVKSILKVEEFADSSTYIKTNRQLYNDMVNKFDVKTMSLFNRGLPGSSDAVMAKDPGYWPGGSRNPKAYSK